MTTKKKKSPKPPKIKAPATVPDKRPTRVLLSEMLPPPHRKNKRLGREYTTSGTTRVDDPGALKLSLQRKTELIEKLGPGNYSDLAVSAGLNHRYVARVLRGLQSPMFTVACRIADVAGISLDELRSFIALGISPDVKGTRWRALHQKRKAKETAARAALLKKRIAKADDVTGAAATPHKVKQAKESLTAQLLAKMPPPPETKPRVVIPGTVPAPVKEG